MFRINNIPFISQIKCRDKNSATPPMVERLPQDTFVRQERCIIPPKIFERIFTDYDENLENETLVDYVKKHDFNFFGKYRIVLGIIVILYFSIKSLVF